MPFDGFLGPSSNDFSQTRILHRLFIFYHKFLQMQDENAKITNKFAKNTLL